MVDPILIFSKIFPVITTAPSVTGLNLHWDIAHSSANIVKKYHTKKLIETSSR